MLPATRSLCGIGMVAGALMLADALPARAQTAVTRDDIIAKLNTFESAPEIDVPALRTQVMRAVKITRRRPTRRRTSGRRSRRN